MESKTVDFGETLAAVAAGLTAAGYSVTIEYPGFVALQWGGDRVWSIGTANGYWGGDLTNDNGLEFYDAFEESEDSLSWEADRVVSALVARLSAIRLEEKGGAR